MMLATPTTGLRTDNCGGSPSLDIPENCVLHFSEMQVKSKHSEPCCDPCYNN